MKDNKTIEEVAKQSKLSKDVCELVVTAYEEYGAKFPTKMRRKDMDEIVEYLANVNKLDKEVSRAVMNNVFDVVDKQLREKIPFMKKGQRG